MINFSILKNNRFVISIWGIIALFVGIKQYSIHQLNNYYIFKYVFYHTIHKQSLYAEYPEQYLDHNHYGPIFSLFIAPFALLPDFLGVILWSLCSAGVLLWAIFQLPLSKDKINLILWICVHEFFTSLLGLQFNPIMTAMIILSYVNIRKEKDFWSAFFIVLGTFIKLYGVVGLAFFFFSKNKKKFIGSLVLWAVILFVLPMFISSPEFILNSYQEWFARLVVKNQANAGLHSMQDISVMGMFRRILGDASLSNLPFLGIGVVLFGLPYLRIKKFTDDNFQLLLLASVLVFTVIFSSGSESPTYIIAFVGVAIWFATKDKPISKLDLFLLIFALILTSLGPSDLMPKFLKENYIKPYALKALPCVLIWIKIICDMWVLKGKSLTEKSSPL